MKKDPNSPIQIRHDESLPRSSILRGRRNFRRLFERSSVLRAPSIHLRYRVYDDPDEGFLIGFAVSMRTGKATARNRTKRLLREVYRTHRHFLSGFRTERTFGLHGLFMAQRTGLSMDETRTDMTRLLEQLRERLEAHIGTAGRPASVSGNRKNS